MNDLKSIITQSRNLKLLYVEDNESARASTIGVLKEFFDDIFVAVDGEDGVQKFKENKIDIIITDINMPKMNGLEMLATIRKIDKDVFVLVFSAYNEAKYFVESIKLGVDGYLLKPLDMKQFLEVISKINDKSEGVKNTELLKQYKEIADKSSIVSIIDPKGIITYVNDAFCEISEYSREELIGAEYYKIANFKQVDALHKEIWDTIGTKKEIWQGIGKNISKSGKVYYLESTIKPILDTNNEIIEYIALRNDITAIMNPTKQLNDVIEVAKNPIVAIINIEDYSNIENFYGQKFIQNIESIFADEFMNSLSQTSVFQKIYILGNGKFALAIDKEDTDKSYEEIVNTIKEFEKNVNNAKINIGELDYEISILVSLAYGDDALENAKYGIKKLLDTKQDFILANNFARKEHDESEKNLNTLKMVKKAIEDSKVVSYFQPIVDNNTQEIVKYESLVRLIDENDKVILPYYFLDIAKKGKYYSQITSIVLDNSFNSLKDTDKGITINISVVDIEKEFTRNKLFSLLKEDKGNASRVTIELLEDEEAKDFEVIKTFIKEIKSLGVQIAVDDFGSGYSNFERLVDYQPDVLKIDGSLIKNIVNDDFAVAVVKTIVNFAKEQGISTVAEYVENKNIYEVVCDLGVDYSQGYYFSEPVATF